MFRSPLSFHFSAILVGALLAGCATVGDPPSARDPSSKQPAITTQPQNQSVSPGTSASFSASADGTAPLTYQWQKNGVNIIGATANTYSTPPTAAGDDGSNFAVVVSNAAGRTTSSIATLTISPLTPRSYSTKFLLTENPISEGGNWINGGENGSPWCNVRTIPDLAFGMQSGLNGYDDSTAVLRGTWNPDQMAQGLVHTTQQNANIIQEIELRIRTSISPQGITGYEFNFRALAKGNTYIQIVRWNGPLGSFSILAEIPGPGVRDGDLLKATASRNTLTAYINGVQVLQTTDTTFNNGSPGIGFFNSGGDARSNGDFGFENFYAAELPLDSH